MNSLQNKVFKRVCGTHLGVLLLLLLVPFIKGCFKPKEIITFIDLAAAPPPAPESMPAPEPEPVQKPEPKPEPKKIPEPKLKPIPVPPKTNTPPKVVKTETKPPPKKTTPKPPPKAEVKTASKTPPKIEKKPAPKPKPTEAERLAAIRQNNPVSKPSAVQSKPLDLSGLKSALNSAGTAAGTGSSSGSGTYSPFAGYYDSIRQQMYTVWQQPTGTPPGITAEATVRIEADGRVSSKFISRRSGNIPFDQSIQNVLNETVTLPVPPANLPNRTIAIEFVLTR